MTAITRLEHTPTVELSAGMSEFFGSAVASEEDVLAVGAPSASDGTEFIDGSVFLYHQQGGQWVAGEQLSPKEHQKSVNQSFGTALAFSGDVLYVGAPNAGDPLTGRLAGLVYVYQNTPAGWEEIAQLAPDEPATHENFGSHLSAQGDTLAVSGGFQGRSPASGDLPAGRQPVDPGGQPGSPGYPGWADLYLLISRVWGHPGGLCHLYGSQPGHGARVQALTGLRAQWERVARPQRIIGG